MTFNTLDFDLTPDERWLRLQGELNYATVADARERVAGWLDHATPPVVVDLRDLTFITSMGIEMLLSLVSRDAATSAGRDVVLLVNPIVEEVLKAAGVASLFTLARAEADAAGLAGLTPPARN